MAKLTIVLWLLWMMCMLNIACIIFCACEKLPDQSGDKASLVIKVPPHTKGNVNDQDGVWDLNVYVFDAYGSEVYRRFSRYSSAMLGEIPIDATLLKGCRYAFYIIANAGYDMGHMEASELDRWKLYISRPEGNIRGLPMSAYACCMADQGVIDLTLVRLMCKVSLSLDKSRLDTGIRLTPAVARVGNCPRCVQPFADGGKGSAVESQDEVFVLGYSCDWTSSSDLFLLENTALNEFRSYIEAEFDYISKDYESVGGGLIYRFYIDDGTTGVQRDCHYHINICPQGDALGRSDPDGFRDSWRIDTSNLRNL